MMKAETIVPTEAEHLMSRRDEPEVLRLMTSRVRSDLLTKQASSKYQEARQRSSLHHKDDT